jgi:hypothetical protein
MTHPKLLKVARLFSLGLMISPSAFSADTVESVNAKLKTGAEVGWIIEGSTNDDDDLAVLFTSHTKGSKPTGFPWIIDGVDAVDTNAVDQGTQMLENVIVSLKQKRVIARLPQSDPDKVHYPRLNHSSLEVLWGPDEEGRHLGLLFFGGKWSTREVLLFESDGKSFRQTSILSVLDPKTAAYIQTALKGKQGASAENYAITYGPLCVVKPGTVRSADSPVTVKIGFSAEIPKGDEDSVGGTLTVLLESSQDKISAKVLKVMRDPAP